MLGAGRLTAPCHWQRCLCQHLQRSEREGCDAVRGAPLSAVREVCSAEGDERRPSGFRVRKRIVTGAYAAKASWQRYELAETRDLRRNHRDGCRTCAAV